MPLLIHLVESTCLTVYWITWLFKQIRSIGLHATYTLYGPSLIQLSNNYKYAHCSRVLFCRSSLPRHSTALPLILFPFRFIFLHAKLVLRPHIKFVTAKNNKIQKNITYVSTSFIDYDRWLLYKFHCFDKQVTLVASSDHSQMERNPANHQFESRIQCAWRKK